MGLYTFKNIGLKALSATVPKNVVETRSLTEYNSPESIEKFIEATGVKERRFADEYTCASDLSFTAANEIFQKTDIKKEDIDVLIFVSQTPDYKIPGTSVILQDRLGLRPDTLVYDVNMSCSGFLHGILMAYTFLMLPKVNNVMVLVGDTLSKLISPRDKGTGMLLGDAGTCTVVGHGEEYGESFFSMQTEGNHFDSVNLIGGGSRKPSSPETMTYKEYEDGSIRNEEQIVMVGPDVFGFAISKLPKDIKRLMDYANVTLENIDKFAFHQANNFMMDYIAKKSKVDKNKILHSIQKYGNTAGTSIPLCLCENKGSIYSGETIMMNAIGAGFAYGTAIINVGNCKILNITEI